MRNDATPLRDVARMMRNKTPIQFRIAAATLFVALLVLSTLGLYTLRMALDVKRQFFSNDAVHVILVDAQSSEHQTLPRHVQFRDREQIERIFASSMPGAKARVWNVYQINFGILDSTGRTNWVESVDPGGALLLGLLTMRDDTGYAVPPTPSPLILQVPVVRVTQGGYESDRRVSMTLSHTAPITRQAPLFSLQSEATGENALGRPLFVSYDTYRRILETAYQRPYAALVRAFTQGQDLGIQPVENVAVYVPHVADVDRVARALAGRGYDTVYTFRAFQQLSSTLQTSSWMALVFTMLVAAGTYAGIWLFFRNDLRRGRKDMGILRHLGYSPSEVVSVYRRKLRALFLTCMASACLYTLVGGIVLFRLSWTACALLACVIAAFVGLMEVGNTRAVRKTAMLDIADLVRFSKEEE
ncbi:hypothetical protein [Alicyclobacillus fructus]|uniref:hypothetical protein n=1 Tax=Alicyclobacillus fructus TaxID=2816082 RepID=UPI001A8E8A63|nr:hypothetical protein [Alicyclobacillus fructus]